MSKLLEINFNLETGIHLKVYNFSQMRACTLFGLVIIHQKCPHVQLRKLLISTIYKNNYFQLDSKLEFKVVIIGDQNCYWECCPNREMNVESLKQIAIINYDNPSIQVLGIKSLVADVELPKIEQNHARKVSIQVQDYMSYTDSDSEDQNSKKSQLTNDNSLFPSTESFNDGLPSNEDLQQDQPEMD